MRLVSKKFKKKISVVGLGKLGAPMLAVFASKGWKVTGVDLNEEIVSKVNSGIAPWCEPKLDTLLNSYGKNYRATTSLEEAVNDSDVTFVIVPTPSKVDGYFDNSFLVTSLCEIGKLIGKKNTHHMVVVTSTVMPGSMDNELKPVIEKSSGKVAGLDFGFCYNPEFIALGSVVSDMLHPDVVLIGESDTDSGDWLERFYRSVVDNNPVYKRMRCIEAEVTKLAINTYVTTKISYANMVAELCEKLPNANSDVVLSAVGSDSRIGNKYLRGGTAYGGPCFPRDNRAFTALGEQLDSCTALASATDYLNVYQAERVASWIYKIASPGRDVIGILGLSYKPGTPVTENSQGIALARKLSAGGFDVKLHDELAKYDPKEDSLSDVENVSCIEQFLHQTDVIVLMTPSKNYIEAIKKSSNLNSSKTVIDPWKSFDDTTCLGTENYVPLGVGFVPNLELEYAAE